MTVSVALIVKNETRSLARCLNSIAGHVDEIVIVDTGSTDDTKAIARRYTERVFDFEWQQDFAAARQFAFDRATSDWVFWLDADDVVRDAEKIKPLVESAPPDVDGFYWLYECDRDSWGNVVCEFWRERCVRNNGAFRWQGRIHEVLVEQRPCVLQRSPAVTVEHHRDNSLTPQKLRRNLDILEKEYEAVLESKQTPSPRLLFYLAGEYTSAGDCQKALTFYQRYLHCSSWDDERYLAQTRMAQLYRRQGRYDQAINADLQALKICPHWPNAYFGLAETYYYKNDWHRVVHWSELGRAMPRPETLHILNPLDYSFHWIIFYTNALFHVGEKRKALDWTRRALEIKPDDEWHKENFLTLTTALEQERRLPAPAAIDTSLSLIKKTEVLPQDDGMKKPVRVAWEGPQFMRGSFAVVNRHMCEALLGLNGPSESVELSIVPHGPFDFGREEDPERFDALTARFNASLSGPADVHVTMSYLPEPEPPPAGKWIVYKPWEFTSIPGEWFDLLENQADEVWVPSWFVWRCFVDSGISPHKVHVVPHGVNPKNFNPLAKATRLHTSKSFKFIFVGGTIWRKGIDILLDAYARAFRRADDVSLVIKDVASDSFYRAHNARERIRELQGDAAAPEIVYLTQDVIDSEVAGLYTACDCLVHPFRGEGFALPVIEAMACALPVIVPRGGPCDDYCSDDTTYWIPSRTEPVTGWTNMMPEQPSVLEPDIQVLSETMRHVFEHRDEARIKGVAGGKFILENYTWQNAARIANERFRQLSEVAT
jgi:glycosyltransferase involved in cell wall biosynthesis